MTPCALRLSNRSAHSHSHNLLAEQVLTHPFYPPLQPAAPATSSPHTLHAANATRCKRYTLQTRHAARYTRYTYTMPLPCLAAQPAICASCATQPASPYRPLPPPFGRCVSSRNPPPLRLTRYMLHTSHCYMHPITNFLTLSAHATLVQEYASAPRSPDRERGRHQRGHPRPPSSSSRPFKRSRSRSPPRAPSSKGQLSFPPPKYRARASSPPDKSSFHHGASTLGPSACAVCLGRHRHNIAQCNASLLWDGSGKPRCHRNSEGRLVTPAGQQLCSNWQRPDGCSASGHDSKHECSGCGKTDHGAQLCPRTQKE